MREGGRGNSPLPPKKVLTISATVINDLSKIKYLPVNLLEYICQLIRYLSQFNNTMLFFYSRNGKCLLLFVTSSLEKNKYLNCGGERNMRAQTGSEVTAL